MNFFFCTCVFGLLDAVLAAGQNQSHRLRKGHLQVNHADVVAHGEPRLNTAPAKVLPQYCSDPQCETCMQDGENPNNLKCTRCKGGFGLKHEVKECDNLLNCENECIPCEVKGCLQCSTLALACTLCEDEMTFKDGKCGAKSDWWDWWKAEMPPIAAPPTAAEGAKSNAKATVQTSKTAVKETRSAAEKLPAAQNPLYPFQYYGIGSVLVAALLYAVLIFGVAYCYMQNRGKNVSASTGYLPEDGFSDAICECSQSWPICMWSCFCPCIRWSDTAAQMQFMSFYLGIALWCFLMLGNSLVSGLGLLLIVLLGAWHRNKTRAAFGLPRTCTTAIQDIIAWSCCQPCAIAQEARHVERALGLRSDTRIVSARSLSQRVLD